MQNRLLTRNFADIRITCDAEMRVETSDTGRRPERPSLSFEPEGDDDERGCALCIERDAKCVVVDYGRRCVCIDPLKCAGRGSEPSSFRNKRPYTNSVANLAHDGRSAPSDR